jgi:bacillithiol biosynthesis cysteine-adding enzyme BshC
MVSPAMDGAPGARRGADRLPDALAPVPAALIAGRDRDLLAPIAFLAPGEPPPLPAPPGRADRRELARALAAANQAYGHPRAEELGRRLADPQTRVVVAGQQPALFGGPLYTLTKLAAAARWAERLAARGEPAVAVFWISTEDHDWAELAQAAFPTPAGARVLDLGPDPAPLQPVGMRTFGPLVQAALEELGRLFPGERYRAWLERLALWYRPDARFGEAFARLAVELLGERCPLLLDAMLPVVKSAEKPILRRLVERRREVEAALAARESGLLERGHALQVRPQPGAGQLFLLHRGARRRVVWEADSRYLLRGAEGSAAPIDRLLETIEENPGVVSPGALSRPAVQDALLGTSLQVMGPGEVAYLTQAAALYPVLEVAAPHLVLRPRVLLLEERERAQLAALDPEARARLLDPGADLDRLVAGNAGEGIVEPARRRVETALAELRAPALELDPNLERPYEKTRETVERALDLFAAKVDAAVARTRAVERQRAERLRDAVLPLGRPQERVVSLAHFRGRHGEDFGARFLAALDLDPRCLQVLVLEEEGAR